MTQVIVKEGGEFGANVEMKSQVMLSNEKIIKEQTYDLMISTQTPKYVSRMCQELHSTKP